MREELYVVQVFYFLPNWFCNEISTHFVVKNEKDKIITFFVLYIDHRDCHPDRVLDINRIPIIPFCEQGCKEVVFSIFWSFLSSNFKHLQF